MKKLNEGKKVQALTAVMLRTLFALTLLLGDQLR